MLYVYMFIDLCFGSLILIALYLVVKNTEKIFSINKRSFRDLKRFLCESSDDKVKTEVAKCMLIVTFLHYYQTIFCVQV